MRAGLDRDTKINFISTWVVCGLSLAVFFHYILGFYFHLEWPYNTFLFWHFNSFADFHTVVGLVKDLNALQSPDPSANYFPFAYLLVYPFTFLEPNLGFGIFIGIFIIYFMAYQYYHLTQLQDVKSFNQRISRIRNVFIFSFLTYPFLFCIDRGNIEAWLFIFTSLSIGLYFAKKEILSGFFLALAISAKLYPILFCLLYLSQKKYKLTVITLLMSALISLGSFMLLSGSFVHKLQVFIQDWALVQKNGLTDAGAVKFSATLYGGLKVFLLTVFRHVHPKDFLLIYNVFALLTLAFIAYFVIFCQKSLWRQLLTIAVAIILLPQVSFDYKLLYLFIPLWGFINETVLSPWDLWYSMGFALLLIPKDYWILYWDPLHFYNVASLSVVLNPFILLAMLFLVIFEYYSWGRSPKLMEAGYVNAT